MSLDLLIGNFIDRHQLPVDFELLAKTYYLPLGDWLRQQRQRQDTLVVGINGCQGSGKSTLADFLQQFLEYQGLSVASLSIDDLYLTRAQRQQLAKTVHPLLQTRGVPGTHDTAMGIALIDQLRQLSKGEQLRLPRFDKASDDRLQCAHRPPLGIFRHLLVDPQHVGDLRLVLRVQIGAVAGG